MNRKAKAHPKQRGRKPRRRTNGIPAAISAGRIPLRDRAPVESLRRYMRELSRAAGRGATFGERRDFARRCGSSVQYLVQLYLGIRRAQPAIALRIEQATYGLVRAEDLCPDFDWMYAKMRGQPRGEPRPSAQPSATPEALAVADVSSNATA